jgi:hypothetical protein
MVRATVVLPEPLPPATPSTQGRGASGRADIRRILVGEEGRAGAEEGDSAPGCGGRNLGGTFGLAAARAGTHAGPSSRNGDSKSCASRGGEGNSLNGRDFFTGGAGVRCAACPPRWTGALPARVTPAG